MLPASPGARPLGTAEATSPWLYCAVVVAIALINLQLWPILYPPRVDLPNHLARHAIQCADPVLGGLGAYYDFTLRLMPNLAADLVYASDLACRDILLTSRVLTQLSALNLVLATFALHYVLWRHLSVWPAAAAFLMHNLNFGYGFENYSLAAPMALWLLAGWILLERAPGLLRLSIMLPLAFGLYVLHLLAFGFFVLMLVAWEVQAAWNMPRSCGESAARCLLRRGTALPVAALPVTHFLWVVAPDGAGGAGRIVLGTVGDRLDALFSLTTPLRATEAEPTMLLQGTAALLLLLLLPAMIRAVGGRSVFHPRMLLPVLLSVTVAFLMPAIVFDIAVTHVRYPFLAAAVVIAAVDWRLPARGQMTLAAVVLAFFALRVDAIRAQWDAHERQVVELVEATADLPPDARALPAIVSDSATMRRHSHSFLYVGMYHGSFSPLLFTGVQPLAAAPGYEERTGATLEPLPLNVLMAEEDAQSDGRAIVRLPAWRDWRSFYTHVILLDAPQADTRELRAMSRSVRTGSFFGIFELGPVPRRPGAPSSTVGRSD